MLAAVLAGVLAAVGAARLTEASPPPVVPAIELREERSPRPEPDGAGQSPSNTGGLPPRQEADPAPSPPPTPAGGDDDDDDDDDDASDDAGESDD